MELNISMSAPNQVLRTRLWLLRIRERRTLLLVGDFLMGMLSLGLSLYYWGSSERFMGPTLEFVEKRVPFWFFFLPLVWLLLLVELYDVHRAGDFRRTVRGIISAALIGFILYLFLYFYYVDPPKSLLPRRGVASFLVFVSVSTLTWRWIYIRLFTAPQFMRRVLLVGGGQNGLLMLKVINSLKVKPFELTGIIDDDHRKLGAQMEGYQVIGTSDQLLKIIEENNISDLIVTISGSLQGDMFQVLIEAQERGIDIIRMPTVYEELLSRIPVHSLEADWILRTFVDQARVSGFYELGKRLIDIIGALVGLIMLSVTLPFIGLLIVLDDGWPIFYTQTRSGRNDQPYEMLKFRTMRKDAEADGKPKWARKDDRRATRVGRVLRRTHLDELPQFFNVLRGEMSLVGPRAERPELMKEYQSVIPFYRARLLVKPGMTGWAQINYGYASTVDETRVKLEFDLFYIKHRNLLMEFVIMLRTPSTVLGLRGR